MLVGGVILTVVGKIFGLLYCVVSRWSEVEVSIRPSSICVMLSIISHLNYSVILRTKHLNEFREVIHHLNVLPYHSASKR